MPPFNTPNLEPSKELVYALGAILGDGHIRQHKGKRGIRYEMVFAVQDEKFANSVMSALQSIGLRYSLRFTQQYQLGLFEVVVCSKAFYSWLREMQSDRIKLREIAEKYPASFIRGFYEAEGGAYVRCVLDKRRHQHRFHIQRQLSIDNTKRYLLELVQFLLKKLGVHIRLYGPYTRSNKKCLPCYRLATGKRETMRKILGLIKPCIKTVVV